MDTPQRIEFDTDQNRAKSLRPEWLCDLHFAVVMANFGIGDSNFFGGVGSNPASVTRYDLVGSMRSL